MRLLKRLLPLFVAAMVLPGLFRAERCEGAESVGIVTPEICATVTFMRGAPMLMEDSSQSRPLTEGQTLYAGSAIQTDGVSRIEMAFPGGGFVRLAEDTALELGGGGADAGEPAARQQLLLLKGDMWANFSGQRRGGPPRILVAGALISGAQSIFRAVMYREGGVEVKTYTGQVTASGPFEIEKEDNRYSLAVKRGDQESPLESWRYQITPYHKMIVLASGEASQPFRFAAKSDLTDWVRWNQERDEKEK